MFRKAAGYFRGAYIYKRIQGFLNEIFEGIERKDVKLRGELLEGASFTLTNLVLRPGILAALNLPMILKSGTIGKLTISGLDSAAARSGKITISVSDITFIFVCPSKAEDLTPEHVIAARRTLLDMMSVRGVAYWSDSSLRGFLETAFGAADWESNEKKGKKRPTPKVTEEAATRARWFEWMEYAYKNVELVVTGLHVRFEGARSKTGTISAVGLTLPALRFRPTESQNILHGVIPDATKTSDAATSPNVKQMFRLFVVQNLAVYVDVEAESYLDELFPQKIATGEDIDENETTSEEKEGKAAKREGERRVGWLRHMWSHDKHDALLFPVNTSLLSTFHYDPKGAKTLINDAMQVKVGPVRLCFGMAQLNALGGMVDLVMRRMRRSETLQFLYLDALHHKHLTDTISLPPFAKPPPQGAILPLPCNVDGADLLEVGRSAIRWKRKLFGDKWALGMWRWAYRCVRNDLKSERETSNLRLLAQGLRDGTFLALVDLYKKRHFEALKLSAALAACAANQRRSSRGSENDLNETEEKASVFVPLLLTDPLEEEEEWALGGLEVSLTPRLSLLARRVASLELTLEGRRESLTSTERKLLAADYVRFVGWKKQGVFLSHMGRFLSSSILPEAVADYKSPIPLPPTATIDSKGKQANRWRFGFGNGGGTGKKKNVKVEQAKVEAYGDLVDEVELVFQTNYKLLVKEGAAHEKAKLMAQRAANTEKELRMEAFRLKFPEEDEEERFATPMKDFSTPAKTSPKYNFSANDSVADSGVKDETPESEEASFMQKVGFGSDDEDDSDDEAALDKASKAPPVPPRPSIPLITTKSVASPGPPVPPKPTASPGLPVPPKPTALPAPPIPPKPTIAPVPSLPPNPTSGPDTTSEASMPEAASPNEVERQARSVPIKKNTMVRSLMFSIDGSVSVEFRVPTVKVKKQSLFRVGAEGLAGSLLLHSDGVSLGAEVTRVEVLHWLTEETVELNETAPTSSFEETKQQTSPPASPPMISSPKAEEAHSADSPQSVDNWLKSLGPVYLQHVATERRLYASNHCEWEVGVGGLDTKEARQALDSKDTVWNLVAANDMSGVVLDNVDSGRKLFARKYKPRRNGRKKHVQHLQEFGAGPRDAQVFPDNIWNVTRLSRVPTERGSFRVIFKNEVSQRYLIAVSSQEQASSVGAVDKSEEMGDLEWEVIPINAPIASPKVSKKSGLGLEANDNVKEEERITVVARHADDLDDSSEEDETSEPPEVVASARQALAEGLITKQEFTKLIGHHMSFLEAAEMEAKVVEAPAPRLLEKNTPTLLMRSAPLNKDNTKSKFISFLWKKFDGPIKTWELKSRSDHVIHAAIGPKLDALLSAAGPHLVEDDVLGPELAAAYEKKDALIESARALVRLSHCGEGHRKLKAQNQDNNVDFYTQFLTSISNHSGDVDFNVTLPALRLAREFASLVVVAEDDQTPTKSLVEVEALHTTLVHRAAKVKATLTSSTGSKILSAEVVKSPRHMRWLEAKLTAAAKQHLDTVALFAPEITENQGVE